MVEGLKAGGLPLDSGMTGIREIVTMTVVVETSRRNTEPCCH